MWSPGYNRLRVLIETYWNVKYWVFLFLSALRRINRNILECKGGYCKVSSKDPFRINRNILECKDDSSTDERVQKSSINRNILECKGILENAMIIFYIVLIETYWNVKCINADPWWDHRRVLIETYWNVKFVKIVDKTADHMVLIETYWNVKFSVIG